jgi:hypothetical protein
MTPGYWLREHPSHRMLELTLRGAFLPADYANMSTNHLSVWIQLVEVSPGFQPFVNLSAFKENNVIFFMVSWDMLMHGSSRAFLSVDLLVRQKLLGLP